MLLLLSAALLLAALCALCVFNYTVLFNVYKYDLPYKFLYLAASAFMHLEIILLCLSNDDHDFAAAMTLILSSGVFITLLYEDGRVQA